MIAILGGGVAGVALAGALARRGARGVTVFDPRRPAQGSTGAALGGFRLQHGSALNIELARLARPWFEAHGDRVDFQVNGYLYLAASERFEVELAERAELQLAAGVPIEHPDGRSLVPFMNFDGYRAANFCALDGVYRPPLILAALSEEARAAGAELRYECAPPAAEVAAAEKVVVASGIWSAEVGRGLGVELAVTPLERVVWQLGPFDWLRGLRVPLTIEADTGYHFRERDGRLLVMGPGDQHDFTHYEAWLERRVPAAAGVEPEGNWVGYYEMTADMHPLVGQTERAGVWADCGFSGHGVMQAPALGDCLAAMMLGETPALDISPLSPLRSEPLVDVTQV